MAAFLTDRDFAPTFSDILRYRGMMCGRSIADEQLALYLIRNNRACISAPYPICERRILEHRRDFHIRRCAREATARIICFNRLEPTTGADASGPELPFETTQRVTGVTPQFCLLSKAQRRVNWQISEAARLVYQARSMKIALTAI